MRIDCFDHSDMDQVQSVAIQKGCILSVLFFEKGFGFGFLFFCIQCIKESQMWKLIFTL